MSLKTKSYRNLYCLRLGRASDSILVTHDIPLPSKCLTESCMVWSQAPLQISLCVILPVCALSPGVCHNSLQMPSVEPGFFEMGVGFTPHWCFSTVCTHLCSGKRLLLNPVFLLNSPILRGQHLMLSLQGLFFFKLC